LAFFLPATLCSATISSLSTATQIGNFESSHYVPFSGSSYGSWADPVAYNSEFRWLGWISHDREVMLGLELELCRGDSLTRGRPSVCPESWCCASYCHTQLLGWYLHLTSTRELLALVLLTGSRLWFCNFEMNSPCNPVVCEGWTLSAELPDKSIGCVREWISGRSFKIQSTE
jgi:hypothetical protein